MAISGDKVRVLDVTTATTNVKTAVYTLSDFVESLNATEVSVSLLDFYTNGQVNGSLLLDPDCPYNVSFEGEATGYVGQPWLALPTVEAAAAEIPGGNSSHVSAAALTSWEAGGMHQSFGRQAGGRCHIQDIYIISMLLCVIYSRRGTEGRYCRHTAFFCGRTHLDAIVRCSRPSAHQGDTGQTPENKMEPSVYGVEKNGQ